MSRRQTIASVASEEAIVSALLSTRRDAVPLLEFEVGPADFCSPEMGAAFAALLLLHEKGASPSVPAALGAAIEATSIQLDREKLEYLACKQEQFSDRDLLSLAKTVRDLSVRRRLKGALERAAAALHVDGQSVHDVLEDVQQRAMEAVGGKDSTAAKDGRNLAQEVFVDAKRLSEGGQFPGVSTGFVGLDQAILGFLPGELVVVGARPGMGKSALLGAFASHVSKDRRSVLIFSLEMPAKQVVGRMVSADARVGFRSLRTGQLSEQDWSRLAAHVDGFDPHRLFVSDRVFTLPEMRQQSRRIAMLAERAGNPLTIIGVDYLQLMNGSRDNRQEAIAEISRGLKMLAVELQVTVVALSQLNRALESRPEKRPMLSDIRESGAIEQDADAVLFVHRPNYYDESAPEGEAEIIVAKYRNGTIGTGRVRWVPATMKYEDVVC